METTWQWEMVGEVGGGEDTCKRPTTELHLPPWGLLLISAATNILASGHFSPFFSTLVHAEFYDAYLEVS